jgi:hypothetical protein
LYPSAILAFGGAHYESLWLRTQRQESPGAFNAAFRHHQKGTNSTTAARRVRLSPQLPAVHLFISRFIAFFSLPLSSWRISLVTFCSAACQVQRLQLLTALTSFHYVAGLYHGYKERRYEQVIPQKYFPFAQRWTMAYLDRRYDRTEADLAINIRKATSIGAQHPPPSISRPKLTYSRPYCRGNGSKALLSPHSPPFPASNASR